MAFYAARGWSTDDLSRAASWTPEEREFFRIARNLYWEDITELMMLCVNQIVMAVSVGTEPRDINAWRDSVSDWYKTRIDKTLSFKGE